MNSKDVAILLGLTVMYLVGCVNGYVVGKGL